MLCLCVPVCDDVGQAGPALAKFKANVWAAIAEKYPNVDINAYAPIRKASAPLQSAPRPIVTPTYTPQTFAPAPQPVPQPQQQVPVVKPVSTGNPFTTHTPVTTQESTNPFQRYQAPSPAPAPAPRNPFASTPPLSRSGSMKLTASDLEPTAFTGVPDSAHIDGLRTFYSAVAPEKVGQVTVVAVDFAVKLCEVAVVLSVWGASVCVWDDFGCLVCCCYVMCVVV